MNKLLYYFKTQRDDSYQTKRIVLAQNVYMYCVLQSISVY